MIRFIVAALLIAAPAFAQPIVGNLQSQNNLSDLANPATARTNLGLGSAAVVNNGTSGAAIPLLNGANTWSAAQSFSIPIAVSSGGTGAATAISARQNLGALSSAGVIDAANYGVQCDGSTDDTAAINAALAATSTIFGGLVQLPAGNCVTSGPININNNNVTLAGRNIRATTIVPANGNFTVVSINNNFYEGVRDLTIQDNGHASTGGPFWAIGYGAGQSGTGLQLRNLQITGTQNGIEIAAGTVVLNNVEIFNLQTAGGTLQGFIGVGVYFAPAAPEIHDISELWVQGAYLGVRIDSGWDFEFTHAQINTNAYNLLVNGGGSIRSIGGYWDTAAQDNVVLNGTGGSPIVRVTFDHSWYSSAAAGAGIRIIGAVEELEIDGLECYDNHGACIDATAATNISGLVVRGLKSAQNGGCAVSLAAGLSGFTLQGNVSAAQGEWAKDACGINIPAGASDNYFIANNRLQGNGSADLVDGGTGLNKAVVNNLLTNGPQIVPAYSATGSANTATLAGSATTAPVAITATGSDANVGINLVTKGTGAVTVNGNPFGCQSMTSYAPVFGWQTPPTGMTYTSTGAYCVDGKKVTAWGSVTFTAVGTGAGGAPYVTLPTAQASGLPYGTTAGSVGFFSGMAAISSGIGLNFADTNPRAYMTSVGAAASGYIGSGNFTNTSSFTFLVEYYTN